MRRFLSLFLSLLVAAPAGGSEVERGRDPLQLARSEARHRVWVLLDTSTSMHGGGFGPPRKLPAAVRTIEDVIAEFRDESGEPLAHWALATFQERLDEPDYEEDEACSDPTLGAGLPYGSPGAREASVPIWWAPCRGVAIRTEPDACDAQANADDVLRRLPRDVNSTVTPNGIGLWQLALHIRGAAAVDPVPGRRDFILALTDGEDTCECGEHLWKDFNEGPRGRARSRDVALRSLAGSPEEVSVRRPEPRDLYAWNAGLKARAAYRALRGEDPANPAGDVFVVGYAMGDPRTRERVNHLGWMASDLRRPTIHAGNAGELLGALRRAMDVVTLPDGMSALSPPALATVKELVARSPSPAFPGSDPSLQPGDLVADPSDPDDLSRALRLRAAYRDNILISTAAELHELRGHLRARPSAGGAVVWDAGERLRDRDPDGRTLLFNRPGRRALLPFRVGEVSARDVGVAAGFLAELDGKGARTAADAAEIVVRVTRGAELGIHPKTGRMYGPGGRLHFTGGAGTWKLREALAAPVAVGSPPTAPDAMTRRRDAYRPFFDAHVNRRTVAYLPTSGGMLHAFAADTGHEIFAYVPDDVLGPAPGETEPDRVLLRDLVEQTVVPDPGYEAARASRFSLAGSASVRDLWLEGERRWATVLAFGRDYGGRFLTALDVSQVGDGWRGDLTPAHGGPPRLLFNVGPRDALAGLGHTPVPALAEVPGADGATSVVFQTAGAGAPGDDSGEWLFALSPETGNVLRRYRLPSDSGARIAANATPAPPALWRESYADRDGGDLVTRVFAADVQGQIHRLDVRDPSRWKWGRAFSLGPDQPVLTAPVALALPGRTEPHLLVVTGGDRRIPGGASQLALLRESGTRLVEVWRRSLDPGEAPQGVPAVVSDGANVDVLLATRLSTTSGEDCSGVVRESRSRLRAFDGLTGAPAAGVVATDAAFRELGPGAVRGIALSASGNAALSFSSGAGEVIDAVIGDFKFRIPDRALKDVTLFVEGFRRSPF